MLHGAERANRFVANPLCWRISRNQFRMILFQGLQLAHQPVVLCIRNFRVVEYVISIIVVTNLLAQRFDFFSCCCRRRHC